MNFIDACGVLADSTELMANDKLAHEAREIVRAVVNAYDALEPDWSQAPDGAQYYAIDADGAANWYERKVATCLGGAFWGTIFDRSSEYDAGCVDIPLGIDWRQCF